MNHRIRVLGIAPYEGMKTLMSSVVADYPQIDLTLFVGDMEQGLEIARSNFHGDYDVVISRGGTAKMLQKNLALPVIEIDISMYDILCALKLADGLTGKTAMVSFANITSSAHLLCDLMKYNMDIYTIDSAEAVEPTLRQLQKNDYQSILCDMISNTTAKRLGLNSFLITSGVDSIRKAFDQALLLCRSQQRLRDENQFFRQLIQGQIGQTMVFDQDGNLFLSTLDDPKPELLLGSMERKYWSCCAGTFRNPSWGRNAASPGIWAGCSMPSAPGASPQAVLPTPLSFSMPEKRLSPQIR